MTQLIYLAKSGSRWSQNELNAYRITIMPQVFKKFFGNVEIPVLLVKDVGYAICHTVRST
jgi:hypothetical protein